MRKSEASRLDTKRPRSSVTVIGTMTSFTWTRIDGCAGTGGCAAAGGGVWAFWARARLARRATIGARLNMGMTPFYGTRPFYTDPGESTGGYRLGRVSIFPLVS